jgi:hypothetical protein
MAGVYDIHCEQGATFHRRLTWRDADGDPINLTGYTARMQVRRRSGDQGVVLELTTENDRITLGDAAGTIDLDVDADVMAAVEANLHRYDLELESPGGQVTRLLQGSFNVDPEVTR